MKLECQIHLNYLTAFGGIADIFLNGIFHFAVASARMFSIYFGRMCPPFQLHIKNHCLHLVCSLFQLR